MGIIQPYVLCTRASRCVVVALDFHFIARRLRAPFRCITYRCRAQIYAQRPRLLAWHGMRAVVLWTMQTIAVLGREWSYECLEDKQTKPFRAQHNYMPDWWNSTFSICLKPTHASYNILLLLLLLLCVCVVSSSHSLFHNADGAIVELNETDGWQGRDQ